MVGVAAVSATLDVAAAVVLSLLVSSRAKFSSLSSASALTTTTTSLFSLRKRRTRLLLYLLYYEYTHTHDRSTFCTWLRRLLRRQSAFFPCERRKEEDCARLRRKERERHGQ